MCTVHTIIIINIPTLATKHVNYNNIGNCVATVIVSNILALFDLKCIRENKEIRSYCRWLCTFGHQKNGVHKYLRMYYLCMHSPITFSVAQLESNGTMPH